MSVYLLGMPQISSPLFTHLDAITLTHIHQVIIVPGIRVRVRSPPPPRPPLCLYMLPEAWLEFNARILIGYYTFHSLTSINKCHKVTNPKAFRKWKFLTMGGSGFVI